jgi:hypothetical protein
MPNASALYVVQQAIYGVLSADATLLTLADAVLGFEPEAPPEKFIVIGGTGMTERADHTLGGTDQGWGWQDTVPVHCYSYFKGNDEVLAMLARIVTLLNFQELRVTGYRTAICEYAAQLTKELVETKDKRERRHITALFTVTVKE